jgi:hypothetical protein
MENRILEAVFKEDPAQIRLKRAKSLLRRIDPRCWDDLRKRSPEQIANEFRVHPWTIRGYSLILNWKMDMM